MVFDYRRHHGIQDAALSIDDPVRRLWAKAVVAKTEAELSAILHAAIRGHADRGSRLRKSVHAQRIVGPRDLQQPTMPLRHATVSSQDTRADHYSQ